MKRKKKTLDIDLRYVTVTDVTVYSGGLLLLPPQTRPSYVLCPDSIQSSEPGAATVQLESEDYITRGLERMEHGLTLPGRTPASLFLYKRNMFQKVSLSIPSSKDVKLEK